MKYDSWEDYKWFLLGVAITSGAAVWKKNGESNKKLKASVSDDESVISVTYTRRDNNG